MQALISPTQLGKLSLWELGSVSPGMLGLVLGRNGNTLKGRTVLPGVINSNYKGKIKVILECKQIMQVAPGQSIAQLLLIPYIQQGKAIDRKRETQKFGSSNIYEISKTHPIINLKIKGKLRV